MREEEVSSPIQGVGGPRVLALSHERASGGSSVRRGGEYTCNAAEVGRGCAAAAAKAILYCTATLLPQKHKKGRAKLVLTSCSLQGSLGTNVSHE